jgi:hypothetical protein
VLLHDLQSNGTNVTTQRNAIGHTHIRFKRAGVGSNIIIESKILDENAHRTSVVGAFGCVLKLITGAGRPSASKKNS